MKSHLFPAPLLSAFARWSRVRFGLPMAGLATLLFAGFPASADSAEPTWREDIIGVVRAPVPKLLLPKVMEIARQVQSINSPR